MYVAKEIFEEIVAKMSPDLVKPTDSKNSANPK